MWYVYRVGSNWWDGRRVDSRLEAMRMCGTNMYLTFRFVED